MNSPCCKGCTHFQLVCGKLKQNKKVMILIREFPKFKNQMQFNFGSCFRIVNVECFWNVHLSAYSHFRKFNVFSY